MKLKNKSLKTIAILDIVIDVLLIGSLWYFVSINHRLSVENKILKEEVVSQENQIIDKDNYIDCLEMVVEASKIFEE